MLQQVQSQMLAQYPPLFMLGIYRFWRALPHDELDVQYMFLKLSLTSWVIPRSVPTKTVGSLWLIGSESFNRIWYLAILMALNNDEVIEVENTRNIKHFRQRARRERITQDCLMVLNKRFN
ncbi:hypothetical protein HOT49_gp165 [Erwinia phage vB_EamM_Alexandra]|uniref:Uncharacterized protein n=1 Tax=Erwinia phage vB_EamM_Alexandra TaxID=2201424 RepID=A0A2Z4QES6_9CAUD|nr:hypothetical protein HOT49_gp165 [Erwinia phage vB_EamM_Alexandra]AWY08617.1 hypothetical protein Alexandra_167 [Erwinia phage vB_EamM_Alexandra]